MKYDKAKEKAVIRLLDEAAKKHGAVDVRHAANRWITAQRARASLAKRQRALKQELARVNSRLRG